MLLSVHEQVTSSVAYASAGNLGRLPKDQTGVSPIPSEIIEVLRVTLQIVSLSPPPSFGDSSNLGVFRVNALPPQSLTL